MSLRLRFLLDTNILIPLQDSLTILEPNLANFVRLAGIGGHQLLYHPASLKDIKRDADVDRQRRTLQRIRQYSQLDVAVTCPWNTPGISVNDECDNEILYALRCDAVHALITEDRGIHAKAKARNLADRVYTIQTAEDWLRRLHAPSEVVLPNVEDVPLHALTPHLSAAFYDSLRDGYRDFDTWFRQKAREGRHAWIHGGVDSEPSGICVYAIQSNERINDANEILAGRSLKLCTFKVGEQVRGRKLGELFLKAAFRYATDNACEHIFVHADATRHEYLIKLLDDFGFLRHGSYRGDDVFVKDHPIHAPSPLLPPLEYACRFFPHYRTDSAVDKYIVPIQPKFHEILFPDYASARQRQLGLFSVGGDVGNAIKLAYLCHAQTKTIRQGDLVYFYRTRDEQVITTVGVVDRFEVMHDASAIASLVSRRTVYDREQIELMAKKPTKVMLFRSMEHLSKQVSYEQLLHEGIVTGPIQSIRRIDNESFSRLVRTLGR